MKKILKVLVIRGHNVAPIATLHALQKVDPQNKYFDMIAGSNAAAFTAMHLAGGGHIEQTINALQEMSTAIRMSHNTIGANLRTFLGAPRYHRSVFSIISQLYLPYLMAQLPRYALVPCVINNTGELHDVDIFTNIPGIHESPDVPAADVAINSLSDGLYLPYNYAIGEQLLATSCCLENITARVLEQWFNATNTNYDGYAIFTIAEPISMRGICHGTPFDYWDGKQWGLSPYASFIPGETTWLGKAINGMSHFNMMAASHCIVANQMMLYGVDDIKTKQHVLADKDSFIAEAVATITNEFGNFKTAIFTEAATMRDVIIDNVS